MQMHSSRKVNRGNHLNVMFTKGRIIEAYVDEADYAPACRGEKIKLFQTYRAEDF